MILKMLQEYAKQVASSLSNIDKLPFTSINQEYVEANMNMAAGKEE
ncbi:hypothetical protein [Peribacillus simplex]|nr:hypothetical protein [Peribacillus simplex]WHY95387.1 hypothetical protein QNH37_15300 [Peribacillus simplex]